MSKVSVVDEFKQKYSPDYKGLKFKTEAEFDKWLKEKAVYYIELEDTGQDLMGFWMDGGGEILQTKIPSIGMLYCSKLVDLYSLEVGRELPISHPERMETEFIDYIVKEIKEL